MYFRTKRIKASNLVQLVESFRSAEGQPRRHVVVSLGDAALPELGKPAIARAVENHLARHSKLLPEELSEETADWVRRILQLTARSKSARPVCSESVDGVVVERVQSENIVQLGPQLVALKAWENLGLPPMLQEAGLNASQIATARLLVAGRLIEPSSEWALIGWAERTALPELLDVRVTKSTKDRLYHVGDALFARRKAIEAALRGPEAGLFDSAGGFEPVPGRDPRSPVEVKRIEDPDDPDGGLILCRSALRREKESAMLSRAESRFLEDLAALRERVESGRLKGESRDWKTLRRLLSTHSLVTTALPLKDWRVLRIRKPSQPDPEQSLVYQKLRINWKAAFRPIKSFTKPWRLCSAFGDTPLILCRFPGCNKKLGLRMLEYRAGIIWEVGARGGATVRRGEGAKGKAEGRAKGQPGIGELEILPAEGIEPTLPQGNAILSRARLPIPPRRRVTGK